MTSKAQLAFDVLARSERVPVQKTISALGNQINHAALKRLRPSKYFTLRAGPKYRVVVSNIDGRLRIEDIVNRDRLTHFALNKGLSGESSKEGKQ